MLASTTHDADTNFLIRQSMSSGCQAFSIAVPPLYTAFIIMKRGRGAWSLNRFLRATWMGGLTGTVVGGGIAYGRYKYSNEESVHRRRLEMTYNTNRIRSQDHSTIGAVLMALLTPAIFWNRANIVNLVILGGAGLGSAIGTLTHYIRNLTGDLPNPVATVIVEEKEGN
ncbi:hypothetical protein P691DRAFT_149582 [Macrolepiota fuliginosa MF-IS2]|uniref:Uncharacterized protein n=1 Tax=Macrolepiota fuliginosa MF-IS2 TaxID=1400762 RepID=A0A9P5XK38_9AGAR|nr:hypothetical protein P691DRAFT_149582 [Macrolepiota fuliginosa MF-IS2]